MRTEGLVDARRCAQVLFGATVLWTTIGLIQGNGAVAQPAGLAAGVLFLMLLVWDAADAGGSDKGSGMEEGEAPAAAWRLNNSESARNIADSEPETPIRDRSRAYPSRQRQLPERHYRSSLRSNQRDRHGRRIQGPEAGHLRAPRLLRPNREQPQIPVKHAPDRGFAPIVCAGPIDVEHIDPPPSAAIPALLIDTTLVHGRVALVAVGVMISGATEVVGAWLHESPSDRLYARAMASLANIYQGRHSFLVVGNLSLREAAEAVFGPSTPIQLCQARTETAVLSEVPRRHQRKIRALLRAAWTSEDHREAHRLLTTLSRRLSPRWPSAGRNLRSRLTSSLCVQRLPVPGPLRRSLTTTTLVRRLGERISNDPTIPPDDVVETLLRTVFRKKLAGFRQLERMLRALEPKQDSRGQNRAAEE